MKTLGVKQFQQMAFKLLKQPDGAFKEHLGLIPKNFISIVYGRSGNGKTEYCIQMAKYLAGFGKVLWLSYEQGHGVDLQNAINRNNMHEVSGNFLVADPTEDLKKGVTFLEDLDKTLSKRNSPDFIFIDSVDYTRFKWEDYEFLKRKYGKKKGFIFISHIKGREPKSTIGQDIKYDGHIGTVVRDYIAYHDKNRFSSFEPYVIYEERARLLNPLFFAPKLADEPKKNAKKAGVNAKKVAKELLQDEGVSA